MKFIKTLLTMLFTSVLMYGFSQQTRLNIQNPEFWFTRVGKIDEAKLVIKPAGIYTECDLFLTFSSGNYLTSPYYYGTNDDDQVEVQYFFNLPQGAIVTDSWLWVEGEVVIADIREREEANQIYESIVNRRQDPSILYKNSATQYELRVYPLIANETRKVKITYLLPNEWDRSSVNTSIPLNLLNYTASEELSLNELELFVQEDSIWTNPELVQANLGAPVTDNEGNTYRTTTITQDQFSQPLNLSYNTPKTEGFFVQKYETFSNAGYYQMALFPNLFTSTQEKKNVIVAFDHKESQTNLSDLDVWNTTKEALKTNLSDCDSFNIAYTKFVTKLVSDKWLPATDKVIDSIFTELWAIDPLRSPASLPSLLGSSLSFIEEHGNEGSILLVSSSTSYFQKEDADLFVQDFISHSDKFAVEIVDYNTSNNPSRIIEGARYYGNGYLYSKLSSLTKGNYLSTRDGSSLYSHILTVLNGVVEGIPVYDVDVDVEGLGFTYSNYKLSSGDLLPNKAVLQVGKYFQNGALDATTFAEIEDDVRFSTTRAANSFTDRKKETYQIWANQKLNDLAVNSNNRGEVVELSLDARVLTRNTAFLALDPNLFDNVNVCNSCLDPQIISSTSKESLINEMNLSVFPNPVVDVMNVNITLPASLTNTSGMLQILSLDGTLILEKSLDQLSEEMVLNLTAQDLGRELEKGVYILTITVGEFTQSIKVNKV